MSYRGFPDGSASSPDGRWSLAWRSPQNAVADGAPFGWQRGWPERWEYDGPDATARVVWSDVLDGAPDRGRVVERVERVSSPEAWAARLRSLVG